MIQGKLFTDGGARGNPGPAAIGAVLHIDGQSVVESSHYLGEATNNQAEYEAIIAGLKLAHKNQVDVLECYLDSELVVKQMRQEYKVKDKDLQKLFVKAWNETLNFKKITWHHIPREKNKAADRLVNLALDKEK
ncbi:MAG: ribonuclease HI family protein [Patescibacteria group bacterium]